MPGYAAALKRKMTLGDTLKPVEHFSFLHHRTFPTLQTAIPIDEPSRQDPSAEIMAAHANKQGKE